MKEKTTLALSFGMFDLKSLVIVLLSTRRIVRRGDRINVRRPQCADPDRVMRAAARCLSAQTGVRVRYALGSFACAAGDGPQVTSFLKRALVAMGDLPPPHFKRGLRAVVAALETVHEETDAGWGIVEPTYWGQTNV